MTSVISPLPQNPDGITAILGFDPDLGVFAGFDVSRHRTFTAGSPSVQISRSTLTATLQSGLSFLTKANGEIAVGVRPDLLYFYLQHASTLHQLGQDDGALDLVTSAVEAVEPTVEALEGVPEARRRVAIEAFRWTRSTSFRRQVLSAYEHRCAVTRHQLKLVEAAHILPVEAGPQSIDTVRNGIALSPTYHRAFDKGLIYVDTDMHMHLNMEASAELATLGLAGGLDEFSSHLGLIHLPLTPELRPDPAFIEMANQYRGLTA